MSRIFISYRRKDSSSDTGRIHDVLAQRFGRDSIFRDVNQIRYGDDFRTRINTALNKCQVLIVVIGEAWLHIKDDYGSRRLDNPADYVRFEIEAALERGIPVIPVLINNATMPSPIDLPSSLQPLTYRDAARVREDPDFHPDMGRLEQALQYHFDKLSQHQRPSPPPSSPSSPASEPNKNLSALPGVDYHSIVRSLLKNDLGRSNISQTASPTRNNQSRISTPAPKASSPKASSSSITKIKVFGVGGGGCNAVNRMIDSGLAGIEFWTVNADASALTYSLTTNSIQLGQKLTRGFGAGGNPSIGQKAAEESLNELVQATEGADLIFVVAGMGGGTGTGAAPIVAEVAKKSGALTVGVASRPFTFEGRRRGSQTETGMAALQACVDTLIMLPNDKLLSVISEDTPVQEAFRVMDDIMRQAVQGLSDIITISGLVNVDFADVRAVMENAGSALMGIGVGSGKSPAREAAIAATSSPLLETSIEGAGSVVFNITGGSNMTLHEVNQAAEIIYEAVDPNSNIIFGAVIDDRLQGEIRITVIASGFR